MRKHPTAKVVTMFLMPRMRNLWRDAHLAEITGCLESLDQSGFADDAIHRNSKSQVPRLIVELWRNAQEQKNLREGVR